MPRSQRIHIISLGCAKNLVDTEVMCGTLLTEGFQLTPSRQDADIILINTCSFIADARTEAEEEIRAAVRWKRRGRRRRVVVAGCLPQRAPDDTAAEYPEVDLFIGLDDVPRVADLLKALLGGSEHYLPSGAPPTYLYNHASPRLTLTPPSHGYVKIAEGCDHRCAYCAIPAIRGRQRSRDMESVLEECRQLLDQGAQEINLIAQDTSRYGRDRADHTSLDALVRKIDALNGHFWLRILYTHPLYVDENLMHTLAAAKHVVPYLDIPLQHISSRVLAAMRRGMTGAETREVMAALRRFWPDAAIRTTFLVGFPGETDDEFQELVDYVTDFRFDRLGVFAYSPEKGTPAESLDLTPVPAEEAQRRRDILMSVQRRISTERNRLSVGTTRRVIVDMEEQPGHLLGRTSADAPDIDNVVHFTARPDQLNGYLANVMIDEATAYDLHGHAVG